MEYIMKGFQANGSNQSSEVRQEWNKKKGSSGGFKRSFVLLKVEDIVATSSLHANTGYVIATVPNSDNPKAKAKYIVSSDAYARGIERINNKNSKKEEDDNGGSDKKKEPNFNPIIIDARFKNELFTKPQDDYEDDFFPYLIAEGVSYVGKDEATNMNVFSCNYFIRVPPTKKKVKIGVFAAMGNFYNNKWDVKFIYQALALAQYQGSETWGFTPTACRANQVEEFKKLIDETAANELAAKEKHPTYYGFILRFVGKLANPIRLKDNYKGEEQFTTHIVLNSTPLITAMADVTVDEKGQNRVESKPITGDFFAEQFEAYKEYIRENAAEFREQADKLGLQWAMVNDKPQVGIEFIPFVSYKASEQRDMFSIQPPKSGKNTPMMSLINTYSGLALNNDFDEMEKTVGGNMAVRGVIAISEDEVKQSGKVEVRNIVNGLFFEGFPFSIHDSIPAYGSVVGQYCKLCETLRIPPEKQTQAHKSYLAALGVGEDECGNEEEYSPPSPPQKGHGNIQQPHDTLDADDGIPF